MLEAGSLYIVPKGVEHRPFVPEETHLLLIEPAGKLDTGYAETSASRIDV